MKHKYKYLRISGVMSLGGELKLRPSYMSNNSRGSEKLEDSPLQMELYCGDQLRLTWGASLLTHSHSKTSEDKLGDRSPQSTADFYAVNAKPPITADVDIIIFLYNGIKVGEIIKPLNEPVISSIDVSEYENLVRVKWIAEHPDKKILNYYVRASSDGGDSWYRLGSLLTNQELLVAPKQLVGKKCLIEVVAYDGFNTVTATTEWSGEPPELKLKIVEPESGAVFCGSAVTLRAEVFATGLTGMINGPFEWSIDDTRQSSTLSAVAWVPKLTGKVEICVGLRHGDLFVTANKRVKVVNPDR